MTPLWAQLVFAHPARLALLFVLPLVVLVAYRYVRFDAAWQRTTSLVCRLAWVALLVAALAGPLYRYASAERFVMLIVDESASISAVGRERSSKFLEEAQTQLGAQRSAVLKFGARPQEATKTEGSDQTLNRDGSDPAASVLAAAASIPAGYVSDVVLLTDGRSTRGDLLTVAERVGVSISVVPLPAFGPSEVAVASVDVPATARLGETFSIQVLVESLGPNAGEVELWQDNKRLAAQGLKAVAGENRLTFSATLASRRATLYEIRLVGFQDEHAQNNVGRALVYPDRPIRALLADMDPSRAEQMAALLRQQGVESTALAAGALPKLAVDLSSYDTLLLSGIEPKSLSPEQSSALETYVRRQGGGLIVVGQAATFGAANYQASSLERLLPVSALPQAEERKSSLALTLVMDRSASMLEDDRLGLAKEAAKQAVALLTPHDKAGVIVFGSESEWISEILPASDKTELLRRIGTIKAEGQTNMYPALAKAFLALEQVDADRRHVILLTDGLPSPGDFENIAARMAAAGITVSTVSISKGAEQSILKDISRAAQGRHHHCEDPAEVPKILVEETKSAAATPAGEFRPQVFRQLPGLDVSTAPLLRDAVAVSPKPRAELLLFGAAGDPLLSWWRVGAGVTMALTADAQRQWSAWPEQYKFWGRLVRHAARDASPRGYSFALSRRGDRGTATLEALLPGGEFLNGATASLELTDPAKSVKQVAFVQVAPGRYEAQFDASTVGIYEATATLLDPTNSGRELFSATRGLVPVYPDEYRVGPSDELLLTRVAQASGGRFNPSVDEVVAPTNRTIEREVPLTWYFVLAAAFVLVADVGVRRYHELFGAGSAADRKQLSREQHVGGANEAA